MIISTWRYQTALLVFLGLIAASTGAYVHLRFMTWWSLAIAVGVDLSVLVVGFLHDLRVIVLTRRGADVRAAADGVLDDAAVDRLLEAVLKDGPASGEPRGRRGQGS